MATYFFATITDAQAATYNAANDTLVFQTPGERANITTVRFNPASAVSTATVSIISGLTGRTVTFGEGMKGEGFNLADPGVIFPDGSSLFVGTDANDAVNHAAVMGDPNSGFYGGIGNDTFDGLAGNDLFHGNQGNDIFNAGDGNDIFFGGQGDDSFDVGGDALGAFNFGQGNLGNDTMIGTGSFSILTLLGGQGDDVLNGALFGDLLNGNIGNDQVTGGGGNDNIHGESGNDSLSGIGTANSSISLDGGVGDDSIQATAGSLSVLGGDGNDNVAVGDVGTTGNGFVHVNAGNDTVNSTSTARFSVFGGQGNDVLNMAPGGGADLLNGNLGDDLLNAGGSNDILLGEDGNDTLDSGGGNNTLSGGAGDDMLNSSSGNDVITGGDGNDTTNDAGGTNTVDVGTGADFVTTAGGDDNIALGDGNDSASAGAGNNTVSAGTGNDSVGTGSGNDLVTGGDGLDFIDTAGGDDNVDGGNSADRIMTGADRDTVQGGDGADTISGGDDTDFLRGGKDADLFEFNTGDSGLEPGFIDQVLDWQTIDMIDFTGIGSANEGVNYLELTATSYAEAITLANALIGTGTVDYVVVQVGFDVVVFADSTGNNGGADDAVVLVGGSLADISAANIS
jgi:Ca2+-binding RTX toxin-like protein